MTPKLRRNPVHFHFQYHWRQVGPIFRSDECRQIWFPCMMDLDYHRATFDLSRIKTPSDWDSCDWRWNMERRGRHPAYWDYACHGKCHWLVDMCLFVAIILDPWQQWRIVTSEKHSTVWNGDKNYPMLFDVNHVALDVSAKTSWEMATEKGEVLEPWVWLRQWCIPKKLKIGKPSVCES